MRINTVFPEGINSTLRRYYVETDEGQKISDLFKDRVDAVLFIYNATHRSTPKR